MARRLIHSEISQDIEGFLATGVKRIDSKGKQSENYTYTIKYKEEVNEFQQEQLAPSVGFFVSNYSRYVVKYKVWLKKPLSQGFRAIHKEGAPHKYSLFWTTDRSLREDEGGNFLISDSGIRIQLEGAKNTMVAWQTKMFHGTSLAKLESIDSDRGRGQVGLSIVSSSRLLGIWERYMDEKIDGSDLEKELEVGEEIWE